MRTPRTRTPPGPALARGRALPAALRRRAPPRPPRDRLPRPSNSSKRWESSAAGSSRSMYPGARVRIVPSPPPGRSRTLRICETYPCRALAAVRGGRPPQRSSIRRSLATTSFACRISAARSARAAGPLRPRSAGRAARPPADRGRGTPSISSLRASPNLTPSPPVVTAPEGVHRILTGLHRVSTGLADPRCDRRSTETEVDGMTRRKRHLKWTGASVVIGNRAGGARRRSGGIGRRRIACERRSRRRGRRKPRAGADGRCDAAGRARPARRGGRRCDLRRGSPSWDSGATPSSVP